MSKETDPGHSAPSLDDALDISHIAFLSRETLLVSRLNRGEINGQEFQEAEHRSRWALQIANAELRARSASAPAPETPEKFSYTTDENVISIDFTYPR